MMVHVLATFTEMTANLTQRLHVFTRLASDFKYVSVRSGQ